MPRGSRKLFNDFDKSVVEKENAKGRSKYLIKKRNAALIHRYYFHTSFFNNRYETIITKLTEEFFLSPITIPEILSDNYDALSHIKKEKPSISQLKENYPHFNWSVSK